MKRQKHNPRYSSFYVHLCRSRSTSATTTGITWAILVGHYLSSVLCAMRLLAWIWLCLLPGNLWALRLLPDGSCVGTCNRRQGFPKSTLILRMSSEDRSLLDQMRKSLGDREDVFDDLEKENRQLLQGLREMDKDPNLRANNKFIEWLGDNGVWVKTISAWGRAPHPLVIASNTEADGESCGRGLLARDGMSEGELMMTIPLDLCLTKVNAQEILGKDVIPDTMDEYIAIALLLMTERLKGAQSRWKPYFDVLPDAENVYPSFIWTESELDTLKGSPIYLASKSLRAKLTREYEDLKQTTFQRFRSRLPVEKLSYELFLWSFVMLMSRAARLTSKINGEELALVPYADLMNHNPYSNTYIDAQRSGMPLLSRKEEVAVYSDRPYKKFEQVFINYGEKGNGDLLLLYGFALDRNPFDSVDIAVGLSQEDPLYGRKKAFLEKAGRGATSVRFPLQRNRYPSELVDFLRLLLVESDDLGLQPLERTDFNEPISPSLERRVLTTIVSICESYLAQYPTTVAEDETLMGDKKLFQALSRQQRMSVKLRASEKRILFQTIRAVQDELLKLPQFVTPGSGASLIAAGRSFDVLANSGVASKQNAIKGLSSMEDGLAMMNTWVDQREPSGDGSPRNKRAQGEEGTSIDSNSSKGKRSGDSAGDGSRNSPTVASTIAAIKAKQQKQQLEQQQQAELESPGSTAESTEVDANSNNSGLSVAERRRRRRSGINVDDSS